MKQSFQLNRFHDFFFIPLIFFHVLFLFDSRFLCFFFYLFLSLLFLSVYASASFSVPVFAYLCSLAALSCTFVKFQHLVGFSQFFFHSHCFIYRNNFDSPTECMSCLRTKYKMFAQMWNPNRTVPYKICIFGNRILNFMAIGSSTLIRIQIYTYTHQSPNDIHAVQVLNTTSECIASPHLALSVPQQAKSQAFFSMFIFWMRTEK